MENLVKLLSQKRVLVSIIVILAMVTQDEGLLSLAANVKAAMFGI